jgi:hypothetical protein
MSGEVDYLMRVAVPEGIDLGSEFVVRLLTSKR